MQFLYLSLSLSVFLSSVIKTVLIGELDKIRNNSMLYAKNKEKNHKLRDSRVIIICSLHIFTAIDPRDSF